MPTQKKLKKRPNAKRKRLVLNAGGPTADSEEAKKARKKNARGKKLQKARKKTQKEGRGPQNSGKERPNSGKKIATKRLRKKYANEKSKKRWHSDDIMKPCQEVKADNNNTNQIGGGEGNSAYITQGKLDCTTPL